MNINSGFNSKRRHIQDKSKEEIKDAFTEFDAIHKHKKSNFNLNNAEISMDSSNSSFRLKESKLPSLFNPNSQLKYTEIEYNSCSNEKSNEELSNRNQSLLDIINKIQKNG